MSKKFTGILLIILAAAIICHKMTSLSLLDIMGFSVSQLLFAVLFLSILVDSIRHKEIGGILFSIAFLIIVFDDELGLTSITPWTVLAAAFIGTVALKLIFPNNDDDDKKCHIDTSANTMSGESIYVKANADGVTKYVNSDNFKKATLKCSAGSIELFLYKAKVPSGTCTINIHNNVSSTTIHVPASWKVINNLETTCSGVEIEDIDSPTANDGPEVTMLLQGIVKCGSVLVKRD